MSQNVDIQVRLDARQARAELRDLRKRKTQAHAKARSQVWGKIKGRVSAAAGMFTGYSAISRVARMHSGPVDPWAAATVPAEAAVQQYLDEQIGYSVQARRRARAATVETLATNTHFIGNTVAAQEYNATLSKMFAHEEKGRQIIRQVLKGPTLDELIGQAITGYTDLLGRSFQYVYEGLTD